ncbi:hypothetical protein ACQZV8_07835 [Magnetococcales bacterium HHB-1]
MDRQIVSIDCASTYRAKEKPNIKREKTNNRNDNEIDNIILRPLSNHLKYKITFQKVDQIERKIKRSNQTTALEHRSKAAMIRL